MPIRRILIANRGEIAARVIRTCRKLGIETVLAVSDADRESLPAKLADRAVCIGPGRPSDSYLRIETVVQAALSTGCDAIHPGYGFLSERAAFAKLLRRTRHRVHRSHCRTDRCRRRQAAGPSRSRSRRTCPSCPAVRCPISTAAQALAARIGAPLLIKAVGGGGGRGMKRVDRLDDLAAAMDMASAEAGAAFGDARVYLERYVARGRHVEVQVLGDGEGTRDPSRRARLLGAAPLPEADRGKPGARARRRAASATARSGRALCGAAALSRRRHGRVPRRRRRGRSSTSSR